MAESLNHLDELSGKAFEELILGLLEEMGLEVTERSTGADGGVDLVAHSHTPITGGTYIVQCKRQRASIGAPIVRDLLGVVSSRRANKGILISTSRFTAAATEFAMGNPIELVDGDVLFRLIDAHGGELVRTSLGCSPLPSAMQGFVRIVTSEARAVVGRIRTQRNELEKGLRLVKHRELRDLDKVGDLLLGIPRRLTSALAVLGNQARAFSGLAHTAPPQEVRRVFVLYGEVVDDILSLQHTLYASHIIPPSEVPTAYPRLSLERQAYLARVARFDAEIVERWKGIVGVLLSQIEDSLTGLIDGFERVDGEAVKKCEKEGRPVLRVPWVTTFDLGGLAEELAARVDAFGAANPPIQ